LPSRSPLGRPPASLPTPARRGRRTQQAQSKEDKKRVRELKAGLQRKEKALSETVALLVLRKKSPSDLGSNEED